MRKSRFTEAQIVGILREFDAGTPALEFAHRHGIHANTLRLWRSKDAGMNASALARLKQLEAENAQMQRIIARSAVKINAIEELMRKKLLEASRRAEAVNALQAIGLRQREASASVHGRRRSAREEASTKALDDARAAVRLTEVVQAHAEHRCRRLLSVRDKLRSIAAGADDRMAAAMLDPSECACSRSSQRHPAPKDTFTQADEDEFLNDVFEYMAPFFERLDASLVNGVDEGSSR